MILSGGLILNALSGGGGSGGGSTTSTNLIEDYKKQPVLASVEVPGGFVCRLAEFPNKDIASSSATFTFDRTTGTAIITKTYENTIAMPSLWDGGDLLYIGTGSQNAGWRSILLNKQVKAWSMVDGIFYLSQVQDYVYDFAFGGVTNYGAYCSCGITYSYVRTDTLYNSDGTVSFTSTWDPKSDTGTFTMASNPVQGYSPYGGDFNAFAEMERRIYEKMMNAYYGME